LRKNRPRIGLVYFQLNSTFKETTLNSKNVASFYLTTLIFIFSLVRLKSLNLQINYYNYVKTDQPKFVLSVAK